MKSENKVNWKNQVVGTVTLLALLSFTANSVQAFSDDPKKKGLEIAQKLDALDDGFGDQTANMQMVLRDRNGRESKRDIVVYALEVKGDGDKTVTHFKTPRSIENTRFLSFTHKIGSDDQWLYIPKLKRVKRIASNNKSGPFMSSEFAYEDITSQEVEKYTYTFVKDEACGSLKCHVVERYPVDKNSGYTKQVVWLVQGEGQYRPMKIDFYDVKKTHLKTLVFEDYKQYNKRYWRPGAMKMKNHVTGKSTDLLWTDYKFKNGLKENDFTVNAIKRTR